MIRELSFFNDNNIIRVSSFFPEFTVFDNQTLKYQRNPLNLSNEKSIKKDSINKKVIVNDKNDIEKKHTYHEIFSAPPADSTQTRDTTDSNEQITVFPKPKNITRDELLNIFQSDKISYTKIKMDVDMGKIEVSEIFPSFISKYLVFSILENRKDIDFSSNNNIDNEYDLFYTLHDEISDDLS